MATPVPLSIKAGLELLSEDMPAKEELETLSEEKSRPAMSAPPVRVLVRLALFGSPELLLLCVLLAVFFFLSPNNFLSFLPIIIA